MGMVVSAAVANGPNILEDLELPYEEYRRRKEKREKKPRGYYDLAGHYIPNDKKDELNYIAHKVTIIERTKEQRSQDRSLSPHSTCCVTKDRSVSPKRAFPLSPPGSRPPHRSRNVSRPQSRTNYLRRSTSKDKATSRSSSRPPSRIKSKLKRSQAVESDLISNSEPIAEPTKEDEPIAEPTKEDETPNQFPEPTLVQEISESFREMVDQFETAMEDSGKTKEELENKVDIEGEPIKLVDDDNHIDNGVENGVSIRQSRVSVRSRRKGSMSDSLLATGRPEIQVYGRTPAHKKGKQKAGRIKV